MANSDQWMVFARANCQDCDWQLEAKNAQGVAAQHAEKYGHSVKGEIGYAFEAKP